MKQIYLLLLLLFSSLAANAQEDLNRTWFLVSMQINGTEVEIPDNVFPDISFDTNGELYEGNGACNSFSGEITASLNEITMSSFTATESDCSSSEEEDFEGAYFGFFMNQLNEPIPYQTDIDISEIQELLLTNETGDTLIYESFTSPPDNLVSEAWYLDYFEKDGVAQYYPPVQDGQESFKIVSFFENNSDFFQEYVCFAGGGGFFYSFNYFGAPKVEITTLGQLALDCEIDILNAYDFSFTEQLEGKIHTYEIIEEGEGRRMILTDENGDRIFYENAFLSTQNFVQNITFNIYPNPARDFVQLELPSEIDFQSISVFNVQGRLMLHSTASLSAIDVSEFSAGMYFVQVQSAQGTASQKFIKK